MLNGNQQKKNVLRSIFFPIMGVHLDFLMCVWHKSGIWMDFHGYDPEYGKEHRGKGWWQDPTEFCLVFPCLPSWLSCILMQQDQEDMPGEGAWTFGEDFFVGNGFWTSCCWNLTKLYDLWGVKTNTYHSFSGLLTNILFNGILTSFFCLGLNINMKLIISTFENTLSSSLSGNPLPI